MKKFNYFVLVTIVSSLVVACGGNNPYDGVWDLDEGATLTQFKSKDKNFGEVAFNMLKGIFSHVEISNNTFHVAIFNQLANCKVDPGKQLPNGVCEATPAKQGLEPLKINVVFVKDKNGIEQKDVLLIAMIDEDPKKGGIFILNKKK